MGRDYCDEFHQIDTTSADEIMKVVVCSKADGLLSYASDVAALPAAIVCEKLNLPTNLSQSVEILTKKHLFCSFLRKIGLPSPNSQSFTRKDKDQAFGYMHQIGFPVMIKPVDAVG